MANGGTFDPETKYVQLGERVENQARQIADIDVRMRHSSAEWLTTSEAAAERNGH